MSPVAVVGGLSDEECRGDGDEGGRGQKGVVVAGGGGS